MVELRLAGEELHEEISEEWDDVHHSLAMGAAERREELTEGHRSAGFRQHAHTRHTRLFCVGHIQLLNTGESVCPQVVGGGGLEIGRENCEGTGRRRPGKGGWRRRRSQRPCQLRVFSSRSVKRERGGVRGDKIFFFCTRSARAFPVPS